MYYEIYLDQTGHDRLTATEHLHENTIEIIQVIKGRGNLLIGKHIYEFSEGDVFAFDAGSIHCTTPAVTDDYVRNKLIIDKKVLLLLTDNVWHNVYFKADEKCAKMLSLLFKETYKLHHAEGCEILAVSEILRILHICFSSETSIKPSGSGIAFQIMNFVNQNPSGADSLDTLASEIHMSKFHMCRKFKEETGITVHSYIKSRKLSLARKLLCETDSSIACIAYESGFSDTACFTKAFKKETGLTPSAFRKCNK